MPNLPANGVQEALETTIDHHLRQATTAYQKLCVRGKAARIIHSVLASWRLLPDPGGEYYGYRVDKFDYACTAIQLTGREPASLDYQVVRCLTDEFKNHPGCELSADVLQGIIDGAQAVLHKLTAVIEQAGPIVQQMLEEELGSEPWARTATYTAVLKPSKHVKWCEKELNA